MANLKLSKDKKFYEIYCKSPIFQDKYDKFVLTVNQVKWLRPALEKGLVALWRNSANRRYQVAIAKQSFMFDNRQIPKNSIIAFDRADMLWVASHFAFTVKRDKDGKKIKRCMIPKKHLKYLNVQCYDLSLKRWEDTIIGRGSLMFNIHDAISQIGVNHVEYIAEPLDEYDYANMMKHSRKHKKSSGGRVWDNTHAIIDNVNYRGYTDESHWKGEVGSRVAHYARYAY